MFLGAGRRLFRLSSPGRRALALSALGALVPVLELREWLLGARSRRAA